MRNGKLQQTESKRRGTRRGSGLPHKNKNQPKDKKEPTFATNGSEHTGATRCRPPAGGGHGNHKPLGGGDSERWPPVRRSSAHLDAERQLSVAQTDPALGASWVGRGLDGDS